ncbi:MAG: alpha/beta fold hydrolase [Promethearchaeota archaeon]|nr:MAG: alpha/beta fold hydrolase [Candidatus Lokiarchaeota archaeon]
MEDIQQLLIPNNDVQLEAEYFPAKNGTIRPCTLICHPHPQFGGDMYNNVVSYVFKTLIDHNLATLRFNFRGVGKSTGSHTGGQGEISDVIACIDFLISNLNIDSILICGYSYGAAIGCSAINYSKKLKGFVAISFPWDFMGNKYKKNSQTNKPKLFIQGNKDNIAHYSKFLEHYDDYDNPKEYKIIDGADHFYWGHEKQVAELVYQFYTNLY